MSGVKRDLSGYNYGAISSLVLNAGAQTRFEKSVFRLNKARLWFHLDRRALPRRDREPDGLPESLVGRIDPRDMGSRILREAPKDLEKKKKAARSNNLGRAQRRRGPEPVALGHSNVIDATQDVEGLMYRPRTAETREMYELMLATVHRAVGDQAQDIVRSAADAVLETLKLDSLKDFDKKKEVEDILGPLSSESFSQLLSLSKKITDYAGEDEATVEPDVDRRDAEIDDEIGVNVVFEEDEGDEEEEEEAYEIREGSGSDEDNEEGDDVVSERHSDADGVEELTFGVDSTTGASQGFADRDIVSPHEVDGFWLQRLLSASYPDPVTANDKTTAALGILSAESSLRDCENELMELFDYDKFELVRVLTKNRDVVVWCTKISRSDEAERMDVEVAMREKGVGWILRALAGDRTKPAATPSDTMDIDAPVAPLAHSSSRRPGQQIARPYKTLDLEGMAFSQGGRLMSNKKVSLPEGSFKRSKKGYEEIHIPPPKPSNDNEARVSIDEMPLWARPAFKTAVTLNRIQSKLYPMAFHSDEPILLCAPTGAGKVSRSSFVLLPAPH
jgi:pre-mRNA-splicing helicase BRR2